MTPSTVTLTSLDTTAGSDTEIGTTTGSTTIDPDGTSTTTTGDTDTDGTTTGGQALPGQTVNQLVTSGTRTMSRTFTLVYTLGQPSQLQSTHESSSYRLQGGLIGANGSPP